MVGVVVAKAVLVVVIVVVVAVMVVVVVAVVVVVLVAVRCNCRGRAIRAVVGVAVGCVALGAVGVSGARTIEAVGVVCPAIAALPTTAASPAPSATNSATPKVVAVGVDIVCGGGDTGAAIAVVPAVIVATTITHLA